jgi:SAM-dependent methyltransferase
MAEDERKPGYHHGVRHLTLHDIAPDSEIVIHRPIYDLKELCRGKKVADIGCGFGRNRPIVESVGGTWVGVEPFEGGAHTVIGTAENLPFEDNSFDVIIMEAVIEHVRDPYKSFAEVSRVLRPGGVFVGYIAYMECFHEISYAHLSFKAIEHLCTENGMKLEIIKGGSRFGIDYHLQVLLHPLPFYPLRGIVAWWIRTWLKMKSWGLRIKFKRSMPSHDARKEAELWYKVECLRMSNGFTHLIRKL